MKKKTLYNLIMVAIIVAILGVGIFGVGYVKGWFDKNDGSTAVLENIVGVVYLERAGVRYPAEKDTVLRDGDIIAAQTGATADITLGSDRITLGMGAEVEVKDAKKLHLHQRTGELFINAEHRVIVSFTADDNTSLERPGIIPLSDGDRDVPQKEVAVWIQQATAMISYRTGTQTLRVFRGEVEDLKAGQEKEYLGGKESISTIKIESLNAFTIAQIRKADRESISLCITAKDLDDLEEKRRQELEDMINGTNPPVHEHSYAITVINPTCTEKGYTLYQCECGEHYQENEVAATGHSFGGWKVVVGATAEKEGLAERSCRSCDYKEQKSIDRLEQSHTHTHSEEVVAPTCTEKGYTLHTCPCGDSYTDNEVKATGHQYKDQVIAPTCTVEGYTVHTCIRGDHSYTDSKTEALGHDWGAWETVTEATETTEGLKKHRCNRCEITEEATIPVVEGNFVYITIRCDTILNNWGDLNPSKAEFVPADGVILPMIKVSFEEGETVLDVLKRICAEKEIQIEYSWTPLYGSYYIEGINQLYEFDCGGDSGWMYSVNGWFPNYGCSEYYLKNGEVIRWAYTCKGLGTDVGAPEWEGD